MPGEECSVKEQQLKSSIFLEYVIIDLDYYMLFEFFYEERQNYAFPHGYFYAGSHHCSI